MSALDTLRSDLERSSDAGVQALAKELGKLSPSNPVEAAALRALADALRLHGADVLSEAAQEILAVIEGKTPSAELGTTLSLDARSDLLVALEQSEDGPTGVRTFVETAAEIARRVLEQLIRLAIP